MISHHKETCSYITPPFPQHIEKYLQCQWHYKHYICAMQTWFTYAKSLLSIKKQSYACSAGWNRRRETIKMKNKTYMLYNLQETCLKISVEKSAIQNICCFWLSSHATAYQDLWTCDICLPWDFDYNSIQNTNILVGAVENFLTSKLLLFSPPEFF